MESHETVTSDGYLGHDLTHNTVREIEIIPLKGIGIYGTFDQRLRVFHIMLFVLVYSCTTDHRGPISGLVNGSRSWIAKSAI
jgi:hypothetical protein